MGQFEPEDFLETIVTPVQLRKLIELNYENQWSFWSLMPLKML